MTQKEAYDIIMEEVNSQSSLSEIHKSQDTALTFLAELSQSKVGIVRLMAWVFAFVAALVSQLWERVKAEIIEIRDTSEPGTDAWMAEKARQFRWNHDPFPDGSPYEIFVGSDNIPTFSQEALDDENALIVKFSAAETIGGLCLIKVNGSSGGLPVAIDSSAQRDAIRYYMNRIKPGGADITVVSRSPDLLTLISKIYYDPVFFTGLADKVNAAIINYINQLPFNGVVSRDLLKDAIRKVPGIVDVVFEATKGRPASVGPGAVGDLVFVRQYKTYAGSILFDQTNSVLTYLSI
jgi:hypothetical protein